MRFIKLLPLLAMMAAAVLATSVPAVASAATWTQEGEPLEEAAFIQLDGSFNHQLGGAGIECTVDGEAILFPGTGGYGAVTDFETPECATFGPYYSKCDVTTSRGWMPLQATAQNTVQFNYDQTWEFQHKPESTCLFAGQKWHVTGEMVTELTGFGFFDHLSLDGPIVIERPLGTVETGMAGELSVDPAQYEVQ
jgi:hypothetical protein